MSKKALIIFGLSSLLLGEIALASHIRAGEIIARRISARTYEFTFIGYRDTQGVEFGAEGILQFGDGNSFNVTVDRWSREDIGNNTERWQFTERHTYEAASNYLVSFTDIFRNADIQNIAGSDATPFHVETLVVIDPLISNSTPFFTVPPIDQAIVGAVFEHNPGAFDPDGDSLSYRLVTPKQDRNVDVNGFRNLVDPSFYDDFAIGNSTNDGIPELSIDPVTGTLVWDAPGGATIQDMTCREFNVAFVVEEWRTIRGQVVQLGFVTRDMQIIVCDFENDPPDLQIPEDTCVVAGMTVRGQVFGTDPNGDQVALQAFGGPFEVESPATFSPNPPVFQDQPGLLEFEWSTICEHVRDEPYDIQFKVEDNPNIPQVPNLPGLVDFETYRIKVVGPPPQGLIAETKPQRSIELTWDPYECTNADSIQVWRRVDSFDLDLSCEPGIPVEAGYELIETVDVAETTFLDENGSTGLNSGSKYCYRLVATFPSPAGGLSIPSEEACDSLAIDLPVITNVDITRTDQLAGRIDVRWTPPYELDQGQFPPPYTYELLRSESSALNPVFTSISGPSPDTAFTDTGINTLNEEFSYKVVLLDNTQTLVDTSAQASSVRLEPFPEVGGINLTWDANVPWSIVSQDFPNHRIFRDRVLSGFPDSLVLIDEVNVTEQGLNYFDDGSFNNTPLDSELEYCYYIETSGSYGNSLLPEPLINRSQIVCLQPNDTIPPCEPITISFSESNSCEDQLASIACGISDQFFNRFSWQQNGDPTCDDDDISSFRIYFSPTGEEGGFVQIGETSSNEFIHDQLSSLAGCYYVTAVDRSMNESMISEVVCNDNCPRYELPNVFTPNNDGKNDVFEPFRDQNRCPRFIQSVDISIVTRDGVEIFNYESGSSERGIFFQWDGTSKAGEELPAATYFYSVEYVAPRLNPSSEVTVIKGWVQLIR